MRRLRLDGVSSCVLAIAAALLATPVAAEPVQASPTADAATVGLWRFQEGQGDRVACEVKAPGRHSARRNLGAGTRRLRRGHRIPDT